MSELPKWPEKPVIGLFEDGEGAQLDYERTMKEAYAARLKVAVDALKEVHDFASKYDFDNSAAYEPVAEKALAAIGELP